ncbi:MAG TPA: DUF354 domain-containing protein [Gammaproteobacteria bacterium]|nr:DUF354 domain-containing protein [Gammaproteobacteria bacterium]
MNVLVDIGHPAHVHFFRHPLRLLRERGHRLLITSRDKEMALTLLDDLGFAHQPISALGKGGLVGLGWELARRNVALWHIVRRFQPDIMTAIGGTSIAQVGRMTGVPSLVFYDTENATLQNAMTYPFASCVAVPHCYRGWLPRRRHLRYRGFHELSYLHPKRFTPARALALANGLASQGDTFFVRLVSWQASHDVGQCGWHVALLKQLLAELRPLGKVLISSEAPLPAAFEAYRYTGAAAAVHHVVAHCRAYIGESATMASEAAMLGVPALYCAQTARGYTDYLEAAFGLVRNVPKVNWAALAPALRSVLETDPGQWQQARQAMLARHIDVAGFVSACVENLHKQMQRYRQSGAVF